MNHLAIYRKYRPSNFDEVSGQKVVVNILKNAIKSNNVSHAYLFTGPRGTGKTSIAKIFARTINCDELVKNNPCNKCISCLNSSSKECVDIIEIDAASNNGVDEIRELKSKINIVPSFLKYKIYIIDEVHMLSVGAFNALLKTLEEPPSHAIFILATTELHKVPATILSRCQVLEFKRIAPGDMKNRIIEICDNENINIDDESINEIVDFSDGCMRDALSLLEKINSYCNNDITLKDVREVCGKPEKKHISELIELIKNNKLGLCLEKINYFYQNDHDMICVVEDIVNELDRIIFNGNNKEQIYSLILSEVIKIYDNMKNSSVNKKIIFEIGLLNFLDTMEPKIISREIISRTKTEQSDRGFTQSEESAMVKMKENTTKNTAVPNNGIDLVEFKKIRINNTFVGANKENLQLAKQKWEELKKYAFDKMNGAKICVLLDGTPVVASDDYLVLTYQYLSVADKVNEEHLEFESLVRDIISCKNHIVAVDNNEWDVAKTEYIKKLNAGEKYQLQKDDYIGGISKKNDIIKNEETGHINEDNLEGKIYELFDSKYVEIK